MKEKEVEWKVYLESDASHVLVDGLSSRRDSDVTVVILHCNEAVLTLKHRQRSGIGKQNTLKK